MSDIDWTTHAVHGINYAKHCGISRPGWLGDLFTSYSPRNGDNRAEGPWCHWVELALSILQHPATAELRPEVHAAVRGLKQINHVVSVRPLFSDEDVARLAPEQVAAIKDAESSLHLDGCSDLREMAADRLVDTFTDIDFGRIDLAPEPQCCPSTVPTPSPLKETPR